MENRHPFRPKYLKFDNTSYFFREELNGIVSFKRGNYFIENSLLDIAVWGRTRNEAEEAFAFAFHALYENFAKKDDKNLASNASRLRSILEFITRTIA